LLHVSLDCGDIGECLRGRILESVSLHHFRARQTLTGSGSGGAKAPILGAQWDVRRRKLVMKFGGSLNSRQERSV